MLKGGLLDDIVIVPLLITLTIKLIPKPIIDDIKGRVDTQEKLGKKWYFALPIVLLYAYLLVVAIQYFRG
ncbi:hypothetical protein [Sphingobacterium sp.]|uniref:hypothetical protein n=1 Tax=Sphingobacterium sp. TaxID=341027 RepID=UPI0031D11974